MPKLKTTNTPGVYKRPGGTYVVAYRIPHPDKPGKTVQKREPADTYEEARALKAKRTVEVRTGEFQEQTRVTFEDYARAWIDRYQGNGRRGFRENTRREYRRRLEAYAIPQLGKRRMGEISPMHIAQFIAWLVDESAQGQRLGDNTIRNILNPVRACMQTAVREGVIRHNPCHGAALPVREQVQDDDVEEVRAMNREQLAAVLNLLPDRHRLMFRFLAWTGLRVSELIALQWQHLDLNGSTPEVRVRRALVDGEVHPPKSKFGRRNVPLHATLVYDLRTWRKLTEWPGDTDPVFPTTTGTPWNRGNLAKRVLKPAAEEAGVPWVGFHTFRHTYATIMFAEGKNALHVQQRLGHHSPSFTFDTYVHLLPDDAPGPFDLDAWLSDNKATTSAPFGWADTVPDVVPDSL